MPHAVIVAHGQPSDPEPAEAALRDYARRVGSAAGGVTMHSATLAAPKRLETVLDGLPPDTVIYPLFMANSPFVTSALPKRVPGFQILDPLGVDPALPTLVADELRMQADELGWPIAETDLVLAAHGSGRSRIPAASAQAFADAISKLLEFASIRVGFVEESPTITDAAQGTRRQSLCLPFFACEGGHVLEDVPSALAAAGFSGHVLPVLGNLPGIAGHIGKRLSEHFSERV